MQRSEDNSLTPLEDAVLSKIIDVHAAHRSILKAQLSGARVSSREISDTGFYANFEIDSGPRFGADMELNRVYANIDGLKLGAGFVLFVRDGRIRFLEGYSYEEKWPKSISKFEVYTDLQ